MLVGCKVVFVFILFYIEQIMAINNENKGKGKGKGQPSKADAQLLMLVDTGLDKGKGKGKGKKGKPNMAEAWRADVLGQKLALQDKENEDEDAEENPAAEAEKSAQELDAAYGKCKSMQLLLTKTKMNMEEILPAFKKNPCCNKHLIDSILGNLNSIDDHTKKIKQIIVTKKPNIGYIKAALTEAAGVIKETQQWISKIKVLTPDDAGSIVSKPSRKRGLN